MDPVEDALQLATFDQLVAEIDRRADELLVCAYGLPGSPPHQSRLYASSTNWQDTVQLYLLKDRIRRSCPELNEDDLNEL